MPGSAARLRLARDGLRAPSSQELCNPGFSSRMLQACVCFGHKDRQAIPHPCWAPSWALLGRPVAGHKVRGSKNLHQADQKL